MAAALLHDSVRAREPEAGPLADALGREERVEDPVADLARHPAALILDREDDVPSGLELEAARIVGTDFGVARPDRQRAAVGHRVARVQREVEEHLLHLAGVGANRIERGVEHRQSSIRSPRTRRSIATVSETSAFSSSGSRVEGLAPAEGEQLARQRGGALRARLDPAQVLGRLAVSVDLGLRQLGVAEHSEQEVVEVVRDARGELADRLDLLRLTELLLGGPALRDVLRHRDSALRLPVRVAQQHGGRVDPDDLSVLGVEPMLVPVGVVLSVEHRHEELDHAVDVLGHRVLAHIPARELLRAPAADFAHDRVRVHQPAVQADEADADRRPLEDGLEARERLDLLASRLALGSHAHSHGEEDCEQLQRAAILVVDACLLRHAERADVSPADGGAGR